MSTNPELPMTVDTAHGGGNHRCSEQAQMRQHTTWLNYPGYHRPGSTTASM